MALTRAVAAAVALFATAGAAPAQSTVPGDEAARFAALLAEARADLPSQMPSLGRDLAIAMPDADGRAEASSGALVARLERRGDRPWLTIWLAGRLAHDAPLRLPDGERAGLAVAELDAENTMAEVVVGVPRADGRCCVRLAVASGRSDGPGFDIIGPPRGLADAILRDIDGDGRAEAETTIAFEADGGRCRPCRIEAKAVFRLAGGAWFEVSGEKAFASVHAARLGELLGAPIPDGDTDRTAFLASYAASAARLGLIETVWARLRRHDLPDKDTRRAVAEALRENGVVPRSLPLEPRR
jgi:hypothetical protein